METILFIIIAIFLFILYWKERKANKTIEEINIKNKTENEKIKNENKELLEKQQLINDNYRQKQKELEEIQNAINSANEVSRQAFLNYSDLLDKEYDNKEKEYEESVKLLKDSYAAIQAETLTKLDQVKKDLDKITSTRAAAISAQLKEEEIKKKEDFYSLTTSEIDKREIKLLQGIESELRNPRPVRMVIWQSYYSKEANELAWRVLGSKDICGIYKITNKKSQLCYIGQAKNIRERFRDHMKFGLGIDTPANNKLYEAMLKEGLEAFTFELIEECKEEDLNKQEKFYISLYDSYHFGYNSNKGIQSK